MRILSLIIILINIPFLLSSQSIDKIEAIIGSEMVLTSEIESQYLQYLSQGYTKSDEVRCKIIDDLLFQNLLVHHAKLDSNIIVNNEDVSNELSKRISYFEQQLGSIEKVELYFKKSIDLNPTNTEGNFGMARVLHQQNKFEEAFTYYVKVLEKNPREIEAHEKMGDLLLQMGDTSNAIRFYQNVLKINSSRIDVEQKLEKLSY